MLALTCAPLATMLEPCQPTKLTSEFYVSPSFFHGIVLIFEKNKTKKAFTHCDPEYHYVPKSPIGYDDINFVNFRFSNFFLAQIHLEILYFHRLGLKSFDFVGKCIIYLPKVSLKHPFF